MADTKVQHHSTSAEDGVEPSADDPFFTYSSPPLTSEPVGNLLDFEPTEPQGESSVPFHIHNGNNEVLIDLDSGTQNLTDIVPFSPFSMSAPDATEGSHVHGGHSDLDAFDPVSSHEVKSNELAEQTGDLLGLEDEPTVEENSLPQESVQSEINDEPLYEEPESRVANEETGEENTAETYQAQQQPDAAAELEAAASAANEESNESTAPPININSETIESIPAAVSVPASATTRDVSSIKKVDQSTDKKKETAKGSTKSTSPVKNIAATSGNGHKPAIPISNGAATKTKPIAVKSETVPKQAISRSEPPISKLSTATRISSDAVKTTRSVPTTDTRAKLPKAEGGPPKPAVSSETPKVSSTPAVSRGPPSKDVTASRNGGVIKPKLVVQTTTKPKKDETTTKSSESEEKSPGSPSSPPSKGARSKIGSLDNARHTAGGGNVRIPIQKLDLSNVTSKCGSKDNMTHTPRGGDKKIESKKLEWKGESKVGSLDNTKHKAGGGDKKIESVKLDFKEKAQSKVGSKDNMEHKAGGGDKKIESVKLDFKDKAQPKIGSKDNMVHKPGGGDKKIESKKLDFKEKAHSKVGSKDNMEHTASGGDKKIETKKLDFKEKAHSKIGSKDNIGHQPGGGDIKIESHKLDFKEKAQPKIGSLSSTEASVPEEQEKEHEPEPESVKQEA